MKVKRERYNRVLSAMTQSGGEWAFSGHRISEWKKMRMSKTAMAIQDGSVEVVDEIH